MAAQSYATPQQLGEYLRDTSLTGNSVLWTELLDRASRMIDDQTGWFFYQLPSTTYLYDGSNSSILVPNIPLVSVSLLESQYYTGGTWNTIASGQYFLQPGNPTQGWPYTWIELTDIPTSGQSTKFWRGKQNIRVTAIAGWPAIPSAITHLTLKFAAKMWRNRASGFAGDVGDAAVGMSAMHFMDHEDLYVLDAHARPVI